MLLQMHLACCHTWHLLQNSCRGWILAITVNCAFHLQVSLLRVRFACPICARSKGHLAQATCKVQQAMCRHKAMQCTKSCRASEYMAAFIWSPCQASSAVRLGLCRVYSCGTMHCGLGRFKRQLDHLQNVSLPSWRIIILCPTMLHMPYAFMCTSGLQQHKRMRVSMSGGRVAGADAQGPTVGGSSVPLTLLFLHDGALSITELGCVNRMLTQCLYER